MSYFLHTHIHVFIFTSIRYMYFLYVSGKYSPKCPFHRTSESFFVVVTTYIHSTFNMISDILVQLILSQIRQTTPTDKSTLKVVSQLPCVMNSCMCNYVHIILLGITSITLTQVVVSTGIYVICLSATYYLQEVHYFLNVLY